MRDGDKVLGIFQRKGVNKEIKHKYGESLLGKKFSTFNYRMEVKR